MSVGLFPPTCNTFLRWLISDKEKRTNWYPEQIPFKDFWFNTWWAPGRYWLFRFFTVYQIKKKREKMLFSQLPSKIMYHKYFKHWKKKLLSRAVKADRKWAAILAENLGDQVIFKTYKYYSALKNINCQITSSVFLPKNTWKVKK